jgi:hypothetical protein
MGTARLIAITGTILAALHMDYSHQTWLLDDGNRPQMRDLAEELGRPQGAVKQKAMKLGLDSGRYYTEEEFRAHMREVDANVEMWERVLHRTVDGRGPTAGG